MQTTPRSICRMLRHVWAVLLICAPLTAQALGLGRLVVNSGLDEPLNGQIELISPTSQEIKTLKTTLASREDFDIAGVERNPLLFDITYSIIQQSNGQYFIKLATHKPVREPFVHFLIQVEWNGGRLIREYSALLDPPQWVAGRPADINAPDTTANAEPIEEPALPIAEVPAATEAPALAEAPTPATVVEETLPPIGTPDPSETIPEVAAAPTTSAPQSTEVAAAPTPAPVAPVEPQTERSAEIEPIAPPADIVAVEPVSPAQSEPTTIPDAAPAPEPIAVAEAPATTQSASQYGPVKKGETLFQISKNLNVDKSVTPQQVMLSLLRANPAAFFGNNVNNLKAGKILTVPDYETMTAMPKAQATKEYVAQYDAWQEYKLKMAGASRAVAVVEPIEPAVTEPKAEASKSETKKTEPAKAKPVKEKPVASAKAVPTDLLKIVRANLEQELADDSTKTPGVETKKDAAQEQRALNERVATLEEAIESKQMQNKEMRERVGKLQEQVKNTERLVELENKEMALAQKQAAEKQVAEAKAALEKAAQEKAAQEKAAQEKAAQDKAAADAAAAKTAESAKPVEPAKPDAAIKKPTATPKPVPAPVPAPAEESFLDSIIASISDNPLTLTLLAALGVLALGVAGMYAYRRHRASREFSESILSSNSLSAEASMSDTSGQAAASDTSFLSDFSQGGMGNIHTDEVDPIAEAEVYLAYGRDEQAEEILKDAIVKDPMRQELKGKLLEIYFQRNDVAAFETLAEELYAALEGKGGKVWDKAEEMGRKLSPNNPMFRGGKPSARAATAAAVATGTAATTLIASEENTDLLSTQGLEFEKPAAPTASSGLDFNLDFDNKPVSTPPPASLDMTFDMDMPEDTGAMQKTSGLDMDFSLAAPEPETNTSNLIDFNSSSAVEDSNALDFSSTESNIAVENEIDFSSGNAMSEDAAAGELPGWDETATKLDLAKAYIDMGDSEGARSILDEVMAEGNDNQKRQARDLAAQIAA